MPGLLSLSACASCFWHTFFIKEREKWSSSISVDTVSIQEHHNFLEESKQCNPCWWMKKVCFSWLTGTPPSLINGTIIILRSLALWQVKTKQTSERSTSASGLWVIFVEALPPPSMERPTQAPLLSDLKTPSYCKNALHPFPKSTDLLHKCSSMNRLL